MEALWIKIIKRNKTIKDKTLPCGKDEVFDTVIEICRMLDIPNPVWQLKHERDFENFSRAVFMPDNFMESVSFDKLEIEWFDTQASKLSSDPRNEA